MHSQADHLHLDAIGTDVCAPRAEVLWGGGDNHLRFSLSAKPSVATLGRALTERVPISQLLIRTGSARNNSPWSEQMLRIRPEQMHVLSQATLAMFVQRACLHLRTCWPEKCPAGGEESVRRLVQLALEQARRYGISSQRGVVRYLDVMCLLGDHFDTDPAMRWALPILEHRTMPGWAKADRLWTEAKRYASSDEQTRPSAAEE